MEQRRRNFREFDDIYRKYGKRFRFPVYLGEEFMETPLDNLELSVRSYNCLWRAGIRNVGNIVNRIDNRNDLLHIRNLGIRSADEIMTALMEYQFSLLSDEGKLPLTAQRKRPRYQVMRQLRLRHRSPQRKLLLLTSPERRIRRYLRRFPRCRRRRNLRR